MIRYQFQQQRTQHSKYSYREQLSNTELSMQHCLTMLLQYLTFIMYSNNALCLNHNFSFFTFSNFDDGLCKFLETWFTHFSISVFFLWWQMNIFVLILTKPLSNNWNWCLQFKTEEILCFSFQKWQHFVSWRKLDYLDMTVG